MPSRMIAVILGRNRKDLSIASSPDLRASWATVSISRSAAIADLPHLQS